MRNGSALTLPSALGHLSVLVLLLVLARLCDGFATIPQNSHHRQPRSSLYTSIERVTSVELCLDVLVFRSTSISSERNKGSVDTTAIREKYQASRAHLAYEAGGGDTAQFVALKGTSVVGAIEATLESDVQSRTFNLPTRVHVKNLRVDQDCRRQGIGTDLLLAVEQYALDVQVDMVTLKVEASMNPNASKLYQLQGYEFREQVYKGFMIKTLGQ